MTASPLAPLHIVARFDNPHAGAELRLLELANRVRSLRPVALWSVVPVHPQFNGRGIRQIKPFAREMPYGGMLLIGGVHVALDALWLRHARPQRLALSYNLAAHAELFSMIERLREATGMDPELFFASRALQWTVGLPGTVEASLLDLAPYLACPIKRPTDRPFTVGRLSRDVPEKHDPQDPALYRALAARGARVQVLGGTCLASALGVAEGVHLLPAGALPAPTFLEGLDAMIYRTGTAPEAYGRVIFEAMASGLPVVATPHGGFAEFIEHGVNGFLVQSQEQALNTLADLAADRALRERIGQSARDTATKLHGADVVEAAVAFYRH